MSQQMPPSLGAWRDSPMTNGQGRRDSVEYQYPYGMPVAPQLHQGFVGPNPMRSRPSPKRSQSPQDMHSPAISAFPSNPTAPASQRKGTPQGQQHNRRSSADRRANNSPTSGGQQPGIAPSGIHAYDRKFVTGIPMVGTPTGTWGAPGVNGGRGGMLGTPERREYGTATTPTVQNHVAAADGPDGGEKTRLEEVLKALCVKHIDRTPPSELETVVEVMAKIETMFWSYLDAHVKSNAKPAMRKFEKGLLKEFTVEILRLRPYLCALWPDAPLGGVDTGKDEINKKKVAELFHRTFCEHKMAQPVAGAVVLSQDLKKMLMVRNRLCTVGWALPKRKCAAGATPAHCAISAVHELTGLSIAARMAQGAPKIEIDVDRGIVKQPQTLFLIPSVPEADVFVRPNEVEWKPLATMPYLESLVNPKAETLRVPVEYESVAVFLKQLKQPLMRMITNLKAGRPLEGPAFDVANIPMTRIFDFHAARARLLARDNRWLAAAFAPPARLPSEDKIAQQRNALQIKLSQELVKALA
ncbi:mRNA-decapping enzyme subunit 2 [Diplonema papillatum]|nr:mRNA-decapping enzyme subunit 2 [Diplonema papillatum]